MDKLEKFINENECEFSKMLPDENLIKLAEQNLNVVFGPQLKKYLLNYGYLAYQFVELKGLNNNQKLNSDICVSTKKIVEFFPKIKGLVLIENQGDGDYYLVNEQDDIFRFCPDANIYKNLNIKLFDYILERFNSVDKY